MCACKAFSSRFLFLVFECLKKENAWCLMYFYNKNIFGRNMPKRKKGIGERNETKNILFTIVHYELGTCKLTSLQRKMGRRLSSGCEPPSFSYGTGQSLGFLFTSSVVGRRVLCAFRGWQRQSVPASTTTVLFYSHFFPPVRCYDHFLFRTQTHTPRCFYDSSFLKGWVRNRGLCPS